jgi:uncharacterized protein YndB with AHSA1/START domain
MSEYGVITQPDTVRLERVLPGPIERVWTYLTDPEKRGTWLAAGPMEQRAGGRMELHFQHANLSARKEPIPERYKQHAGGHRLEARVTRCEPPRVLSFTWAGESREDSEVTFELTPRGNEVLLVLTHRRLPDRKAMISVAGGWHAHLGVLSDLLYGREPGPFWSALAVIDDEYTRRFAEG